MEDFLYWSSFFFLGYFVILNTSYLLMSLGAFRSLINYNKRLKVHLPGETLDSETLPPVTLIAPAYNEEPTCVESTRAFLSLDYPRFEVIVVNDGSSDKTLERLQKAFDLVPSARAPTSDLPTEEVKAVFKSKLHPNLWVIDKENGGKADALNTGINFCQTPLFCAMDADTLIEGEGLVRLVRPFLDDASTVAAGGMIRIANGCTVRGGRVTKVQLPDKLLPRLQVLEYLRAFLFGRVGWDEIEATLIISGAFGLFRRETVVEVGGYARDTVGEDMELVVRLHRFLRERNQEYRVRFIPDPVAWTECPETLRVLGGQRDRWQRGLADTMVRHQRMLANPKYGNVGVLAYPFFYFLEMLGPILEFSGYIIFIIALLTGAISTSFAIAFFLLAFVFGWVLSLSAVSLEEFSFRRYESTADLLQLMALPIIEAFGYRQLIAWYRIRGLFNYVRNVDTWGSMERAGFRNETAETKS